MTFSYDYTPEETYRVSDSSKRKVTSLIQVNRICNENYSIYFPSHSDIKFIMDFF